MSSTVLGPFQLLELNIISAQDLSPVSRSMRAYAVAWVHPNRKLSTRVDAHGRNNPTWNDKFVFRVDEEFLRNDTSAVMIEIFALHWFRDLHVGTVRVLVGNLLPPIKKSGNRSLGMRFVALQVRRPSGTPQGILNIGVALLDSSMRSVPLYTQLSSAVGYRHLMGEEDPFAKNTSTAVSYNQNSIFNTQNSILGKPELRRTKSDTSSMVPSEVPTILKTRNMGNMKASSVVGTSEVSEKRDFRRLQSAKASTMYSESDIFAKANENDKKMDSMGTKGEDGKPHSMVSGSDASYPPNKIDSDQQNSPVKPFPRGQTFKPGKPKGRQLLITESELGPSPSEVAAAKAKEKQLKQFNDEESSIVMAWDVDSSVEGLQSKLERWRAELPPVYDASYPSSSNSGVGNGGGVTARHNRRHTIGGGGPGLFSCFSNVCGCECSIVCGAPASPGKKSKKKSGTSGRFRTPSVENSSFF